MKIWVDLDEVLAQFLDAFLAYHNDTYGTDYTFDQAFDYDFWKVRGGTREEIMDKVHDFHKTPYFKNIKPVEWALSVLQRLKSEWHQLYLITSRQDYIEEHTKKRIQKHFPNIFSDFFFVNHFSNSWIQRNKSDICDEVWIEIMIDDSLVYAEDCARNPERKVLLYNRPRNQSEPQAKNIQRIQNRNEIDNLI